MSEHAGATLARLLKEVEQERNAAIARCVMEAERSLANANHYALTTTAEAARVCQYWRGRAAAFREIAALLDAHPVVDREEPRADPVTRLHNLVDGLSYCDDCGQPACDDAKPEGPHVLCHDCAVKHKAWVAEGEAPR